MSFHAYRFTWVLPLVNPRTGDRYAGGGYFFSEKCWQEPPRVGDMVAIATHDPMVRNLRVERVIWRDNEGRDATIILEPLRHSLALHNALTAFNEKWAPPQPWDVDFHTGRSPRGIYVDDLHDAWLGTDVRLPVGWESMSGGDRRSWTDSISARAKAKVHEGWLDREGE